VLCMFSFGANAQSVDNLKRSQLKYKIKSLFKNKQYAKAYPYLVKLHRNPRGGLANYRMGVAALYSKKYVIANDHLEKAMKHTGRYPDVAFHYANSFKLLGDYENAIRFFSEYQQLVGEEHPKFKVAARHIDGCGAALAQQSIRSKSYDVKRAGGGVNTNHQEIAPNLQKGKLVFARKDDKDASIRSAKLNSPGSVQQSNELKKQGFDIKDPYIDANGNSIYFTRCFKQDDGEEDCKIFTAELEENGSFKNIRILGVEVNQEGFSSQNPVVAKTAMGQEVLYFTSDRPGGQGAQDLWFSVRLTNGRFTRPYNLGAVINSEYNEVTPYYDVLAETLYFSSDKAEGLGGMDVYQSSGSKRYWNQPKNLGMPLNSNADDTYFRKGTENKYVIVSSRNSSTNDDIFIVVPRNTSNSGSMNPIEDTPDMEMPREEVPEPEMPIEEAPSPNMPVEPVVDEKEIGTIEANSTEVKIVNLKGNVLDQSSGRQVTNPHVKLYEISPTGEKLILDMKTNNYFFSLEADKSYKLICKADGFIFEDVVITPDLLTERSVLNLNISGKRN